MLIILINDDDGDEMMMTLLIGSACRHWISASIPRPTVKACGSCGGTRGPGSHLGQGVLGQDTLLL